MSQLSNSCEARNKQQPFAYQRAAVYYRTLPFALNINNSKGIR